MSPKERTSFPKVRRLMLHDSAEKDTIDSETKSCLIGNLPKMAH